jgi:hypothetical protein
MVNIKTNMAETDGCEMSGEEVILYDLTVQAEWRQDPESLVCNIIDQEGKH